MEGDEEIAVTGGNTGGVDDAEVSPVDRQGDGGAATARNPKKSNVAAAVAAAGGGLGSVIEFEDGFNRGGWQLVCKDASYVPNPSYCGLELTVAGVGIKPSKGKSNNNNKKKK